MQKPWRSALQKRLKATEIAPVREALAKHQGGVCPLCNEKFSARKRPALDHDHKTGFIRGVLCLNCNGMEGKVISRATRAKSKLTELEWLRNLVDYLEKHKVPQHGGILHNTHKTEHEKRLARNKKARERRAAAKKAK